MTVYELRTASMWPDADYELRAAAGGFTFEGYAAVFGRQSHPMAFAGINGGRPFREVIREGAFTRTLNSNPDVTLRFQHDMTALPLARTKSGTMTLTQDDRGLRVQALLPDNEWGRPIRDAIARGDIGGMSFRFQKVSDSFESDASGAKVRHLHEVKLGAEVSVTDQPAYPDTIATVRALAAEAGVDADDLIGALNGLAPEARLTAEQREALITVVNRHSDAPVVDAARLVASDLAAKRERLARLRG